MKKPTALLISASEYDNDSRLQRIHESLSKTEFDVITVAYGSVPKDRDYYLSPTHERSLLARLIDVAKMLGSRVLSDKQLLTMLSKRLITKDLSKNCVLACEGKRISLVAVKHWTSLPTALLLKEKPNIWLDINEVFEAEHDNSKLWELIYKPVILRLLKIAKSRIVLRSATSLAQIKFMGDETVLHLPNTKKPISDFDLSQPKTKPMRLLYHGLIATNRALETLLEGLKKSGREDIELTIRGHGKPKYIASLKEKAETLGLKDQIKFEPSIKNSKLIEAASEYDIGICLFANRSQQVMLCEPNKLYEYMAAGLGVIASDTSTMRRMVVDKNIGQVSLIGTDQADFLSDIFSKLEPSEINKWKGNAYNEALSTWKNQYDWSKLETIFKHISDAESSF